MTYGTFKCAECGGTFQKARTDEEALAESKKQFGDLPSEKLAVICDHCYFDIYGVVA